MTIQLKTALSKVTRYHDRIAVIAKYQAEIEEGQRNAEAQRRAAKRVDLQPEYEAVGVWQVNQMKLRGLTSELIAETQAKLDALDAIVDASA